MDLQTNYQRDLLLPNFVADPAQQQAVNLLANLQLRLIAKEQQQKSDKKIAYWQRLFVKKTNSCQVKGLYFWGGVGRGKTYLLDLFFNSLPFERKLRVHFHHFMLRVHHELSLLKNEPDPLIKIAEKLADEAIVICFDEFYVSDITDAMLLATLFEALFANNVTLVATSNILPDNLYANGLQRARFLPAIEMIKQHCDVVNIDSGTDYRLRALTDANMYLYPLSEQNNALQTQYFYQLAGKPTVENEIISINHRPIQTRRNSAGVVQVDFTALCEQPRSASDYIELASLYHSILLSNVPALSDERLDAVRRFIMLVDEFYARGVNLMILAATPLSELYDGRLSFEFERCLSRLNEMRTAQYLAQPHLP